MYSLAVEEFERWGLTQAVKPEDDFPQLPHDLGDLSDAMLMELFNEFTQWANYIAVRLTKAEIDEDDAEAQLKVAEAKYMVVNTGRGEKVTVVRAERYTDPEVAVLSKEQLRCKAFRKMTATLMANTERSTFLLSRELSKRTGLAPANGRTQWTRG